MVAMVDGFASSGTDITQVRDAGLRDQLSAVPLLEGVVDEVVAGVHAAFSLAIADAFWVGLIATLIAMGLMAVGLQDLPIKHTSFGPGAATAEEDREVEAADGVPVAERAPDVA
jgi:hypothetical protein